MANTRERRDMTAAMTASWCRGRERRRRELPLVAIAVRDFNGMRIAECEKIPTYPVLEKLKITPSFDRSLPKKIIRHTP